MENQNSNLWINAPNLKDFVNDITFFTPAAYAKTCKRLMYLKWLSDMDNEGMLVYALFVDGFSCDSVSFNSSGFLQESVYFESIKVALRQGGEPSARKEIETCIARVTEELKACYARIRYSVEGLFGDIEAARVALP
jgi:hypothetical protein